MTSACSVPATESAVCSCSAPVARSRSPVGVAATDPDRTLQDRLAFRQATALVVGLVGCTPERATAALLAVAGHLGVLPAEIGPLFLRCVSGPVDDRSEALVAGVEEAAQTVDRPSTEPPLTVVPILEGDLRGMAVAGELDAATVPLLVPTIAEVYRWAGARTTSTAVAFLLDLSAVSFLDGTGLRGLAGVHDEVLDHADRLHVACPADPGPRRLLHLAVDRGWLEPEFDPPTRIHDVIGRLV